MISNDPRVRERRTPDAVYDRAAGVAGAVGLLSILTVSVTGLRLVDACRDAIDWSRGATAILLAGAVAGAGAIIGAALLARRHRRRRDRAETRLRDGRAWVGRLVDLMPGMVCYLDRDANILFHNRHFVEAVGKRSEQIQGRHASEVLDAEAWAQTRPWIERALRGEAVRFERQQTQSDGTSAILECSFVPHHDSTGAVKGIYGMHHDVSSIKELDTLRSAFMSTASHELRTPLTSISGALALLADGLGGTLPSAAAALVKAAHRNAGRLERLVNDLTDLHQIDAGGLSTRIDDHAVAPVVEEAAAALRALNDRDIGIVCDVPGDIPAVRCDRRRLLQVLRHLGTNACRFANDGTDVRIAARAAQTTVRFEVHNTGPGITPQFRPYVFAPFVPPQRGPTADGAPANRGLGLALCKALVQRMGGTIGYESATDAQTVFYFELPRA
ncbi:Sensor histidine kinase RcsC [Usitatibacter rugosus]|uniref:histidine kinase n=1 Tax=Usitatibacter rugosus TaxID=2732067 RepID=A0A6M4GUX2_9PROT|nr:PAS domain-containing sensor histidine kinase [Usitatibacter rugosus]QJR10678.1 Sensor histidine kinase RcsC [Usitatibacter rugosus]